MRYSLGVDLGGTKTLGALVDEQGTIHNRVRLATGSLAVSRFAGMIEDLLMSSPYPVDAIGLAVAGFVTYPAGRVAFAPNLDVDDREPGAKLARRFGLPVRVENDASAAAWAEHRCGAGQGARDMLMVTVGTGIGGGIVADGRLYRGSRGFAAEFGHVPVSLDGPQCGCGLQGCLEAMASGTALARMARERVEQWNGSELLRLAGGDPEAVTGEMVGEAARLADPLARELLRDLGYLLGVGLSGLAKALDPELIVVGGGVLREGEAILGPAREAFNARYRGQVDPPKLVSASLGNDAGVVGAALLAIEGLT